MKESSYHDPKMVAYYQAVCLLEDKFNGLELNHVTRRFNEVADVLAKLASGQELVPTDVFASDLHKPSVTHQGLAQDGNEPPKPASGASPTSVLADPEVMQIDEDPDRGPDYLRD
jgi:hypothetical protein